MEVLFYKEVMKLQNQNHNAIAPVSFLFKNCRKWFGTGQMIRNWINWWSASKPSLGTQNIHNESDWSSLFRRRFILSNGKVENYFALGNYLETTSKKKWPGTGQCTVLLKFKKSEIIIRYKMLNFRFPLQLNENMQLPVSC